MSNVLVWSDTQSPFQHPKALEFILRQRDKYQCDSFVHIGDIVDNKFLKYASVNDPDSAKRQHELAMEFLCELYLHFPIMKVCNCNHTVDRVNTAADDAKIPSFMLKTPKEYLNAPRGWQWADYWVIDNVRYEHGHRFSGQRPHIAGVLANFQSTVIGHHPILAVEYVRKGKQRLFGACVSSLTVDHSHKRMGYGMAYAKRYPNEMPNGTVVVLDGEQCIPILMEK